jgi:hypothetical protein
MDNASDKTENEKEHSILRAKPVKGEVDWGSMIKEHIARYPNIIAALAEAEKRCAERRRKE